MLVAHGLATLEEFETRKFSSDEFGHTRHGHGIIDDSRLYGIGGHVPDVIPGAHWSERRVHTKKMQREVARLLKHAFALPPRKEAVRG